MTTKEWDELIEQTVQEMEEEDRLDLAAGRIPDNDLELADFRYEEYPVFAQMVAAADTIVFAGNSCTLHLSFGIQDVWKDER